PPVVNRVHHVDVFFFQAEDGIRDFHVTGVQTCALPIYRGTRGDPVFPEVIRSQSLDGEKLLCNLLRCQYVALQVLDEPGIVYRDALKTPELLSEVSEI